MAGCRTPDGRSGVTRATESGCDRDGSVWLPPIAAPIRYGVPCTHGIERLWPEPETKTNSPSGGRRPCPPEQLEGDTTKLAGGSKLPRRNVYLRTLPTSLPPFLLKHIKNYGRTGNQGIQKELPPKEAGSFSATHRVRDRSGHPILQNAPRPYAAPTKATIPTGSSGIPNKPNPHRSGMAHHVGDGDVLQNRYQNTHWQVRKAAIHEIPLQQGAQHSTQTPQNHAS